MIQVLRWENRVHEKEEGDGWIFLELEILWSGVWK